MNVHSIRSTMTAAVVLVVSCTISTAAQPPAADSGQVYQHDETRALLTLVEDAASLIQSKGDAAFAELRRAGSRWRDGESYIFVLDRDGIMAVHPDPAMEGKNEIDLKDVNGKSIVQGLIGAVTSFADKPSGWYHYQWPVPDGLLPRWKSSYVRLVHTPSGKDFIVGSGVYNDRMERPFVVDVVAAAAAQIETRGEAAYPLLRDPTGPFMVKDAYVFVLDSEGVDLVNPAFPNLEGRSLVDWRDVQGKRLVREMLDVAKSSGSGWVDYMWPKPGESVSTQKSTYVRRATFGGKTVIVGCGVYLADAPKAASPQRTLTADELITLVREGAAVLEQRGERAYAEFRQKGSKWFDGDTYLFVWREDGTLEFHAADPGIEGRNDAGIKDIHGRPFGKLILEAANSSAGEGWVHYMYPEPGDIFPTWKSTFVKRVTLPSGTEHIIGCGIFNMQMDRAFIEDVVNRAADLIAARGRDAFRDLRDRNGPFVFMDTYVFVDSPDGVELVNAGQPSLEGKNLMGAVDLKGKKLADEYIAAAMRDGSAWVQYYWYRPGSNAPALKHAFVKKVQFGPDTFVVGSGFYSDEKPAVSSISRATYEPAPSQVDARIALHGVRSLAEWRLRDVSNMLTLIVGTEQVKSGNWDNMTGILQRLDATDIPANAIWFARPDGSYYTVESGDTGLNLSDRPYFARLMAGQSILGALVISKSTGKRSVIVAEPVRVGDRSIGAIGVSYSVDQLSLEIDRTMELPPGTVFYALDANGQSALHRDPGLMFEYPSDMGSDSLRSAATRMLTETAGTVDYEFRGMHKTVLFERSSMLGWVFALGFSEPATTDMR